MSIHFFRKLGSKVLVAGTLLGLASGCGAAGALEFQGVLPEDRHVSINVPGGGGQALVGERSDFYETTYNVSRGINGGVGWVLGLSRAISLQQPTSNSGNTYIWGPSRPQGLESISWRFTAEKQAERHWKFWLEGRPKASSSEADFKRVYEGEVTKESADSRGHGTLALFFDNSQALEQKSCSNGNRDVLEGRADVVWVADQEPRSVDVTFSDFRNQCDEGAERTPARYRYVEATDGAGNFQFSFQGNIHKVGENKPLNERWTIRSRWQSEGAGRSDVTLGEGEIPADLAANSIVGNAIIATECWDTNFEVVYQTTDPPGLPQALKDGIRPTQGEASACVYAEQELPTDI